MNYVQLTQFHFERMIRRATEDQLLNAISHADENITELKKQLNEAIERKQAYEVELAERKAELVRVTE
jgi:hypothetical protein